MNPFEAGRVYAQSTNRWKDDAPMYVLRLLGAARLTIPRVFPLMRDRAVPFWLKAACLGLALLIVSPLDIFSDIPVLGLLDDAALLAMLASAFVLVAENLRTRLLVRVEPQPPRSARVVNPPLGALHD
jgi:uncharacterized membrane protein YkvA (DUF1232 family)